MSDRLLIVGNGFDLAHGLHTRYWDFRSYLETKQPRFLIEFEKMYNFYPIDFDDPYSGKDAKQQWEDAVYNMLWARFEDKMGEPDIAGMLDASESMLQELDLDGGNIGIQDTMDVYWREQYGFVRHLEGYVKEWIREVSTDDVVPMKKELVGDNECLYLTFNYTDTLENVYHIEDVLHIHGSVAEGASTNPIMGHCNSKAIEQYREYKYSAEERFEEGEASIQNAVVNFLESIYKDTSQLIEENEFFFDNLSEVDDITIIGWSAGSVDIPYLKKVADSVCNDAIWHVYWHDDTARASLEGAFNQVGIKEEYRDFKKDNEYWDS